VQLQAALSALSGGARNVEVDATGEDPSSVLLQREDALVESLGVRYLAAIAQPEVNRYLSAEILTLAQVNSHPFDVEHYSVPRVAFEAFDYALARPHIHLLAGALPRPDPSGSNVPPEVLITAQMARDLHVRVGDVLGTVFFEFGP
jgi:hypothetical protein